MTIFSKTASAHLLHKVEEPWNRLFWIAAVGASLAAALALYRLVDMDSQVLNASNPEWLADWAIIWACMAIASLPLVFPLAMKWQTSQKRRHENDMTRALMAISPSMRQEMLAIASRDTEENTLSADDTRSAAEALNALGGLTLETAKPSGKSLETAYGLAKRPLMGYL